MSATLSFGAWLRQRRKALGLTHLALAGAVHCSVSALRKIEGRSAMPGVPADLHALLIDDPPRPGFLARLTATHPSVADRVAALVAFAGGRDPGPIPAGTAPDVRDVAMVPGLR